MPDTGLKLTATVLVACFLFVWEVIALFVFGADPSPTTVYDFAMLFGIPVGFMISATAKEAPAVAGALALGGLAVVIAWSAGATSPAPGATPCVDTSTTSHASG